MAETILEELKRYVGFGPDDESALRELRQAIAPAFPAIAVAFYDRILAHAEARRALTGGESQVGHLKTTLVRWLGETLGGPWGEAYWESHCRIGRVHVRIDLPQHYMFGAMNLVREELHRHAALRPPGDPAARERAARAVDRVLDLELAIMLHTYREDWVARAARTERLATFGQLVGSIGHELRNPLGVIESSVFLLQGRVGEDERARKHLERISRQVQVSNEIITGLLDMVRDRPVPQERVEVAGLVSAAVEAAPRLPGVVVDTSAPEGLWLVGDPVSLRQALVNLVTNAVEAASPAGTVRISARASDGIAILDVVDDGPGIDEAVRGRLFEPLVTSKAHGSGLGLALVRRVAERHRGSVSHEPVPGGGTRFTLRLPLP
jgi:two-component system sensor histidine kinase HydH